MALVKDNIKPSPSVTEQADDNRPIWEIIAESSPEIPPEERAAAPHDGGRSYKHYPSSIPVPSPRCPSCPL